MGKKCLKCGYEHQADNLAPEAACPSCGAIYSKVESARARNPDAFPPLTDEEKIARIKARAAEVGREEPDKPFVGDTRSLMKPAQKQNDNLIECPDCGKRISRRAQACPNCGAPKEDKIQADIQPAPAPTQVVVSHAKSKSLAIVLAIFLGGLGIHKFYLNQSGWGIIYVLFCWTFIPAIIALLEAITYLSYSEKAFAEKYSSS